MTSRRGAETTRGRQKAAGQLVDLACSPTGKGVYSATTGFRAGYPWPWTRNMTLSSQTWTGGQATCTARLYYFSGTSSVTLATLSFTAYA